MFDLCVLLGQEFTRERRQHLLQAHPHEETSMLDIRQAAEGLGIELVGVTAAFDELVSEVPGPKIIHLNNPAHLLVMARASPEWVQLLDGGAVVVAPRAEIEKRYSGHALIPEQEENGGGPRLELPEFHYSLGIAGVGQRVEHAFRVTNSGDQDLAITLQAKGCGAPDATIGKETLAPGESRATS
jgi:hypothetical protein